MIPRVLLRPARRLAVLLAVMLALQACVTVGPDYEPPAIDWLADWQPDLYGQLASPDDAFEGDLRFWWLLFDDESLNGLIEIARRENPSLRIAGLRILESRAALGVAQSGRYPQLQQLGGAITYVNTQRHGGALDLGDTSLTAYQAAFNVGWELDFWGRFRRGIESADAVFLASIANHQDVQVLLTAQVVDLYFAYRTTQIRIDIAKRNAALQARSLEITRQLYEQGQSSELDLQQARTQHLSTLATIPALEVALTQVRNALAVLLGRPPGDLPELHGASPNLPALDPVSIQGVPARLLLRRPDLRGAAWQAAAQSARIGVAKADLYPAITLVGSIGWSADSLSSTADTGTLAIGPALTWNVFDYGRIRNNVRVQDAR
ncbi:MAG: efflux transporter outer membrane subunit, partial [Anaerolineae bacterium]